MISMFIEKIIGQVTNFSTQKSTSWVEVKIGILLVSISPLTVQKKYFINE